MGRSILSLLYTLADMYEAFYTTLFNAEPLLEYGVDPSELGSTLTERF